MSGKGGLAPPFFFGALLVAAAASRDAAVTLWAGAAVLAALAGAGGSAPRPWLSPIAAAVISFAALVMLNNAFVSPSYTAAAIYHPLLIGASYFALRRVEARAFEGVYLAAACAVTVFATGALWQIATGIARGDGGFESPNTLATLINLVLVPAFAVMAWRRPPLWLFAVAALLFAGLLATGSRGGQLGLLAGCGLALFAARRFGVTGLPGWRAVLGALALGALASQALRALGPATPVLFGDSDIGSRAAAIARETGQTESSVARIEMYMLALQALRGHELLGTGYLTFTHVFERGREQVPSYGTESVTYFVHNDYLQALQELGLPGLIALLALVVTPLWSGLRTGVAMAPSGGERVMRVAALGAVGSMAVHAFVDFPFYVPICLLLYGAVLAAIERLAGPAPDPLPAGVSPRASLGRLARIAVVLPLAYYAALPVAAEAMAACARRQFLAGEARNAARALEIARRLQPADWRYHWYAGQFWLAQALAKPSAMAAELAMDAFDQGFRADPNEPRNLLGMIEAGRRLQGLLGSRARPEALVALSARALALAPLNGAARRERILALELAGRKEEARRLALEAARAAPDNPQLARIAERLRREDGR